MKTDTGYVPRISENVILCLQVLRHHGFGQTTVIKCIAPESIRYFHYESHRARRPETYSALRATPKSSEIICCLILFYKVFCIFFNSAKVRIRYLFVIMIERFKNICLYYKKKTIRPLRLVAWGLWPNLAPSIQLCFTLV